MSHGIRVLLKPDENSSYPPKKKMFFKTPLRYTTFSKLKRTYRIVSHLTVALGVLLPPLGVAHFFYVCTWTDVLPPTLQPPTSRLHTFMLHLPTFARAVDFLGGVSWFAHDNQCVIPKGVFSIRRMKEQQRPFFQIGGATNLSLSNNLNSGCVSLFRSRLLVLTKSSQKPTL